MCTSSIPFKSPYKNVFVIFFFNICTINKTINVIFNQAEDSNAGHHSVKVCRFHYKSQRILQGRKWGILRWKAQMQWCERLGKWAGGQVQGARGMSVSGGEWTGRESEKLRWCAIFCTGRQTKVRLVKNMNLTREREAWAILTYQ